MEVRCADEAGGADKDKMNCLMAWSWQFPMETSGSLEIALYGFSNATAGNLTPPPRQFGYLGFRGRICNS